MIAKIKSFSISTYNIWLGMLLTLILSGIGAGIIVFVRGLVVTNLTDLTPWGLWITLDLSSIALSAGAFTLCAAVYLLGLKQLKTLARTAAFIGLTGYGMAMMFLLLDIGRPDRFYNGFIFWNGHSPLWEVTMCVGLYFVVLTIENLPNFARWDWLRAKFPRLTDWMLRTHEYAPYLAVAGLALSVLHQSSLGATFGVLISRPIWYQPGLAGLFFVSAIAGGIAMTLLVALMAGLRRPGLQIPEETKHQVTRFLGWALVVYLYLRFWDLLATTYTFQPGRAQAFELLTRGALSFNFWFGEILLGILIPTIVLLTGYYRRNTYILLGALIMVVGGLVAYRWDINMVGQMVVQSPLSTVIAPRYIHYTPSLVEMISSVGIVAFGLFALTFGVRHLHLIDPSPLPDGNQSMS